MPSDFAILAIVELVLAPLLVLPTSVTGSGHHDQ